MEGFLLGRWSSLAGILFSIRFWWILSLSYAAILAWGARHSMNPDGLSYLDMAAGALTAGPSNLVNGLWSPAYPALINVAFLLFHPSPEREFPLIHFVNFLLFVFALWSFSVFLRFWLQSIRQDQVSAESGKEYFIPFAYCTFLWFTLRTVGVENVTPDLGVVASVFLAAAIVWRLVLPEARWRWYAILGFVLGIGFYFKAIMLPLGLALLAILLVALPTSKSITRSRLFLRLSFSFCIFALVITPFVAGLSHKEHKLSLGDAGRLNYIWHVDGVPWSAAQGNEPNAMSAHPIPVILEKPLTLAFGSPIRSTFPLWYDPSYWWTGAKSHFDLRGQIAELGETLVAYKEIILIDQMPFYCGILVLWIFSLRERAYGRAIRVSWWQILWPLAGCLLYATVHTEERYVSPLLCLFCLAIYFVLTARTGRQVTAAVCSTVLFAVMIPFTVHLANVVVDIAGGLIHPRPADYQATGLALRDLGLKPGDQLAVVGPGSDVYYARYDRMRVIAQVPDVQEFWNLTAPELQALSGRLASIGVNAIVAPDKPRNAAAADWKEATSFHGRQLSVLLLSPQAANGH